jgi:hypothetical protein
MLLAAAAAKASVEPGNWEFSLESPLQGNASGPVVKQRCLTPEEASDPAKVLAEARGGSHCQFSNLRDSGTEYKFDLECTGAFRCAAPAPCATRRACSTARSISSARRRACA